MIDPYKFIMLCLLYTTADRPKYHELVALKKEDGSRLEVTKSISAHEEWVCVDFAEMLFRNDVLVKEYQNKHKRKYNFVRAVLRDWLSRDDDDSTDLAVPRTWEALAECVADAGLDGALAKAIRDTCTTAGVWQQITCTKECCLLLCQHVYCMQSVSHSA